jgi:hypothetical protein
VLLPTRQQQHDGVEASKSWEMSQLMKNITTIERPNSHVLQKPVAATWLTKPSMNSGDGRYEPLSSSFYVAV